jgi:hypothetical protein
MTLLIRFILFMLALLILATGCGIADIERLVPTRITYVEPIPLIQHPIVKLDSVKGTRAEVLEAAVAVAHLNRVFASTCFEAQVLTREFTETAGLNNQEIYNQFRTGIIHVKLIFYTGSWIENRVMGIVGYIRDGIPNTVFQNRYFVHTANDMGRNLIHEIAHLVGFNHYNIHATSIPYQMNEVWDVCSIN